MMLDAAAIHFDWMDQFPEEHYHFLNIPGQCTPILQPLDSGPGFGHLKHTFKQPGIELPEIVNMLAHFSVWVGPRFSMWKSEFKTLREEEEEPFPWDELCGEEEDRNAPAQQAAKIERTNIKLALCDGGDQAAGDSWDDDSEDGEDESESG